MEASGRLPPHTDRDAVLLSPVLEHSEYPKPRAQRFEVFAELLDGQILCVLQL